VQERAVVRQIAKERIEILYNHAKELTMQNTEESRKLAQKYVKRLRSIGMHYRVKIPKEIKNSICKKCNSVLLPGLNAHVRIASSHSYIVIKCDSCGTEKHIFYR